MKLWYQQKEIREARLEAQRLVDSLNKEIPTYINGDVKVRMAWVEDTLTENATGVDIIKPCFIPEAELLVNGEAVRKEHIDLVALDVYFLEMKALRRST